MKYIPKIDKEFKPIYLEILKSNKQYTNPLKIMIQDPEGYNFSYSFNIADDYTRSYKLIERIVKSLIWFVGGNKILINGDKEIAKQLAKDYSINGARSFDVNFMERIYKEPFEVVHTTIFPNAKENNITISRKVDGCRIGFDAGGSDWKVCSVIDGEVVFSQESVWYPKVSEDINYHYENIVSAFKLAAEKMPRVDGIGVSSAGIYLNNKTAIASLFLKVSENQWNRVENIYLDAKDILGKDIAIKVANDGDVTAIAGSLYFKSNNILGIAMGTGEAGGYVNSHGGLNGWLSEVGFVPCQIEGDMPLDEWGGDYGLGKSYLSQEATSRLGEMAGIPFDESLSKAQRLKLVQELMENGDKTAYDIFENIGIYLGYTVPYYAQFYDIKTLLLLGRVTSGKGGDLIVSVANKILADEFPELNIAIITADEKFKRVGQAISAASLPILD